MNSDEDLNLSQLYRLHVALTRSSQTDRPYYKAYIIMNSRGERVLRCIGIQYSKINI